MTAEQTIDFQFGQKHIDYIRACRKATINVAEGAVRAGKTIDNVFDFADQLETAPDKFHLASGSTAANAKLNIGVANGFGLENIFRGRCIWTKFRDNDALKVTTPTGIKLIIFAGGGKADSYKKIRGNSYGMWIATEINLHHDSFIQEAQNRQLAAKRIKVYWDLNPDHPKADIYEKYLNAYERKAKFGVFPNQYYNYQHFTIYDNITISEERRQEIINRYEPDSIWYRRDILGQRCIADGLVYTQFATLAARPDNPMRITTAQAVEMCQAGKFQRINVGVDFGGNGSGHSFVATGILNGYAGMVALKSRLHKEEIDPEELGEIFVEFVKDVVRTFGYVTHVYVDSAEQVLKRGLKKSTQRAHLTVPISDARKCIINDRIFSFSKMVAQKRFLYTEDCETLVDALSTAVWKPNSVELIRLDNGTSDIDTLDGFEYTFERYIKQFDRTEGQVN